MNENSVNVWTTPDGIQFEIPADIYAATTFRKDGWPDKRVKANATFWQWLEAPKPIPALEGADATVPVINGDTEREPEDALAPTNPAQAYAMRVWAGQSQSADRTWRIERVKEALAGQGLSFEGVELPNG